MINNGIEQAAMKSIKLLSLLHELLVKILKTDLRLTKGNDLALKPETTWILVTPCPEVCYPVDIVFAIVKNIVTCVCSCEIGVFVD